MPQLLPTARQTRQFSSRLVSLSFRLHACYAPNTVCASGKQQRVSARLTGASRYRNGNLKANQNARNRFSRIRVDNLPAGRNRRVAGFGLVVANAVDVDLAIPMPCLPTCREYRQAHNNSDTNQSLMPHKLQALHNPRPIKGLGLREKKQKEPNTDARVKLDMPTAKYAPFKDSPIRRPPC